MPLCDATVDRYVCTASIGYIGGGNMRLRAISIAILCLAAGAGCATPSNQPPTIDARGTLHYTASWVTQTVDCDGRAIVLQGSHTTMTLRGACWWVMLTGFHNDVTVDMPRIGRFIITGAHNDVSWRQTEPGPPPSMEDRGESNSFHPAVAYR
jgi:hypothetical protein